MLFPVFKALLGHYRRRPFQILLVWIGLTLGTALLVGVMAVNNHAEQSYAQGGKIFSNPLPYRIRARYSEYKIPQGLYIQLRQAGFNQCIPLDTTEKRMSNGYLLRVIGYDPVSILSFSATDNIKNQRSLDVMRPPYPVVVSLEIANRFDLKKGDYIDLEGGEKLGPVKIDKNNMVRGSRVFVDIGKLQDFTQETRLTMIACGAMPASKAEKLRNTLPSGLFLSRYTGMELTSLTEAFHMNLGALGMLAFLVGVFIFYQALALSFSQRQPMVGLLRLLGVPRLTIATCLGIEVGLWVLLSWFSGNVIGVLLANYLIPAVAQTLNQLYNIHVNLYIDWHWSWSIESLKMVFAACFVSSVWPFIRIMKTEPIRLSTRLSLSRFSGRQFGWEAMIGCIFLVTCVALYLRPPSQSVGFMLIASLLLSAGLILPYLLWRVFILLSCSLKNLRMRWFFSDCASSMSYRSVGAMAFMLAIATNIGIQTVVDSFNYTTKDWLTQRLAADVYIVPSSHQASEVVSWLETQPDVQEIWWRWEKELAVDNETIQVVSSGTSLGEQKAISMKSAVADYWQRLHSGAGVLVSESMALKHHLKPGDNVLLPEPLGSNWEVLGIYYDYGNPYNQLLISEKNWRAQFQVYGDVGLGLVLSKNASMVEFTKNIEDKFNISPDRIFNNKAMYNNAMLVFDQAFSIAQTLSRFTLFIALMGLFFSTVAGEMAKKNQFALMRSVGLTPLELVKQGVGQLFIIGISCVTVAIPLGFVIAKMLIIYVLKGAFGWTMELHFDLWQLAWTCALVFLTLFIAAAWPTYFIIRSSPAKLFHGVS